MLNFMMFDLTRRLLSTRHEFGDLQKGWKEENQGLNILFLIKADILARIACIPSTFGKPFMISRHPHAQICISENLHCWMYLWFYPNCVQPIDDRLYSFFSTLSILAREIAKLSTVRNESNNTMQHYRSVNVQSCLTDMRNWADSRNSFL